MSTTQPLQLLHMDLFGPSRTMSFGGNYYALVIVDDYSRFTWTLFLTHKRYVFHAFKKLAIRRELGLLDTNDLDKKLIWLIIIFYPYDC